MAKHEVTTIIHVRCLKVACVIIIIIIIIIITIIPSYTQCFQVYNL